MGAFQKHPTGTRHAEQLRKLSDVKLNHSLTLDTNGKSIETVIEHERDRRFLNQLGAKKRIQ